MTVFFRVMRDKDCKYRIGNRGVSITKHLLGGPGKTFSIENNKFWSRFNIYIYA